MMKLIQYLIIGIVICVSSLVGTNSVCAAPRITEIRLSDVGGFPTIHMPLNQIVLRANGDLYWLEGTDDAPVRHKYSIGTAAFLRLASIFEARRFFELKKSYSGPETDDGATVVMQVTRDGKKKNVRYNAVDGLLELWELEMLTRGIASQHIGLNRTPISALPTPRPKPISVFRGTKSGD